MNYLNIFFYNLILEFFQFFLHFIKKYSKSYIEIFFIESKKYKIFKNVNLTLTEKYLTPSAHVLIFMKNLSFFDTERFFFKKIRKELSRLENASNLVKISFTAFCLKNHYGQCYIYLRGGYKVIFFQVSILCYRFQYHL